VIVIDDRASQTGATTMAALQAIRNRKPKELVLAVPVGPPDTITQLRREVDALICLETPELFGAIGYFYRDFRQVSDREVRGHSEALFRPKGRLRSPEFRWTAATHSYSIGTQRSPFLT